MAFRLNEQSVMLTSRYCPHPALLPGNYRRQQAHHGMQRTACHISQLYAQGQRAGVLAPGMAGDAGQRQVA